MKHSSPHRDPHLSALEFDRVLGLISLEAKSEPGRLALLSRRPQSTLQRCEILQRQLAEMVKFFTSEGLLPLAGLTAVDATLGHEILDLEESWLVLRAIRATQAMREALRRTQLTLPHLTRIANDIDDLAELVKYVGRYFTKDGKLREDASAELRSLRTRIQTKRSAIQKTLLDTLNRHAEAVQEPIITLRNDRYCIPVRNERRQEVPGILHERSGSGASVFIEPMPVVEMNNDLAELLIQEREEIARIMRDISSRLKSESAAILGAIDVAGELDAIQACAVIHDMLEATFPTFTIERELRLIDVRHPLLDERLASLRRTAFADAEEGRTVVPTSIMIDRDHPALVISGPNAGGKTVALKSAGLIVAMALSGLPVPAGDGTIIPVVDRLHVLIGDDQDLLGHLSTFSAYLVRLKKILEGATSRSLVLLDEIGSGTDPEEGSALAAATIEHLLGQQTLLIVTTHLAALKSFAIVEERIRNASMEFDPASGQPTFRMISGVPGRSRAIDVAQMIGLPKSLIDSARARLGAEHAEVDELLNQLQKGMREIVDEREAMRSTAERLEHQRAEIESRVAALGEERKKLGTKYRTEMESVRTDVEHRLQQEIKRLRETDRTGREKLKVSELAESVTAPVAAQEERILAPQRDLRVGDTVEHKRLRFVGTIAAIDGQKIQIQVGGKRIGASLGDLFLVGEKETKKTTKSSGTAAKPDTTPEAEPSISAELNLIGFRVDDALDESDRFLDRALLDGRGAVRLIHGFGSGRLRQALRDHLKKHPAVRSFRPAGEREGGDRGDGGDSGRVIRRATCG